MSFKNLFTAYKCTPSLIPRHVLSPHQRQHPALPVRPLHCIAPGGYCDTQQTYRRICSCSATATAILCLIQTLNIIALQAGVLQLHRRKGA